LVRNRTGGSIILAIARLGVIFVTKLLVNHAGVVQLPHPTVITQSLYYLTNTRLQSTLSFEG
jgi:hypothetical protein